ncbi:uncharacterized protein BT62DRAFT_686885 [Guyanagaster necrorhizus]|uniref:Uncharacterized protein n=1 Tax=Guyanagaster necrorhizus TaxID=856835 RepID=A0A9P7VH32_9AGAR|nr:uncharacterized protein BT62DRAFT_686885 [Guyanagaster necrorhizus MCA 3950]KAG7439844.1 hypothetical protein BT62DRAFT_686885 [Guyanagaster necrorhizus MCA 3950]
MPGPMSTPDPISHASVSLFNESYNSVHQPCVYFLTLRALPSTAPYAPMTSARSMYAAPESGSPSTSSAPSALTAKNKVQRKYRIPQLLRSTSYISNTLSDFSISVSLSSHPRTSAKAFSVISQLVQRRRQQSTDAFLARVMPSPSAQSFSSPCPFSPEHRLRQLDKLQRVLGEEIPLELVLGPSAYPSSISLPSHSPTSRSISQPRLPDNAPPSHNPDDHSHLRRMSFQPDTPPSRAVPEPWLAHAPPSDNPRHPRRRQSTSLALGSEPSSPLDHHHRSQSSPAFQPMHAHGLRPSLSISTQDSPDNDHTSLNSIPASVHSHSKSSPADPFSPTSISPAESRPFMSLSHIDSECGSGAIVPNEANDTRHPRELSWDMFTPTFPPPRPDTPFLSSCVVEGDDGGDDEVHLGIKKERRQGWSGQWNCDDMREVIQRLRDLR